MIRKLHFIVAGEPFDLVCDGEQMVFAARFHALIALQHTGRQPSDFQIRDAVGNYIDPTTLVKDLPEGVFYLSLAVGYGGSHRNYRRKDVPPIVNALHRHSYASGARHNSCAYPYTLGLNKRMTARKERRSAAVLVGEFKHFVLSAFDSIIFQRRIRRY